MAPPRGWSSVCSPKRSARFRARSLRTPGGRAATMLRSRLTNGMAQTARATMMIGRTDDLPVRILSISLRMADASGLFFIVMGLLSLDGGVVGMAFTLVGSAQTDDPAQCVVDRRLAVKKCPHQAHWPMWRAAGGFRLGWDPDASALLSRRDHQRRRPSPPPWRGRRRHTGCRMCCG